MIKKICGIYKITNPSGKVYIGQSTDVKKRWQQHFGEKGANQQLYDSFFRCGFSKHKFEIIIECSIEKLNELEKYYIRLHKSYAIEFGLNISKGGGCNRTYCVKSKVKSNKINSLKKYNKERAKNRILLKY